MGQRKAIWRESEEVFRKPNDPDYKPREGETVYVFVPGVMGHGLRASVQRAVGNFVKIRPLRSGAPSTVVGLENIRPIPAPRKKKS